MFIRLFTLVALSFQLGACAVKYSDIETPPLKVTPNQVTEAKGLDVYALARERGNTDAPPFKGTALVEVRTNYTTKEDNKTKEFMGADCVLDGEGYKAEFKTPHKIQVPIYGQHSSPLFVQCSSTIGKGNATSEIYNHTTAVRNQNSVNTGLIGMLIITAINSAREDPDTDHYRYKNVFISLKDSLENEMKANQPSKKADPIIE